MIIISSSVSNIFKKFQTQFQNEKSSESKVDKEPCSHQDLAMASNRPGLDGVLALLIGFFAFILGFAMQDTFWGVSIVVFIREAVLMMKLNKRFLRKRFVVLYSGLHLDSISSRSDNKRLQRKVRWGVNDYCTIINLVDLLPNTEWNCPLNW